MNKIMAITTETKIQMKYFRVQLYLFIHFVDLINEYNGIASFLKFITLANIKK